MHACQQPDRICYSRFRFSQAIQLFEHLLCFIAQVDGEWRYDSKRGALLWTIDLIDDTNRSGSMEFVVSAADTDAFYPVEVRQPDVVDFGTLPGFGQTLCADCGISLV